MALTTSERINIRFEDLEYTATKWDISGIILKKESKKLLHNIKGAFNAGELCAIMGPSGAGKTTLLNLLAGYKRTGMKGKLCLNDTEWKPNSQYEKLISYIPQEDLLRPKIKVIEYMKMVANLRFGYSLTDSSKENIIFEILKDLGILECIDTYSDDLSGGQRKRLAIALELVNNPSVLFLDEPTTGLDSLSCTKCISLLRKLATKGKTIICTIHQPSALLFEMFDKVYVLTEGKCMYDDTPKNLLPYLSTFGLICPPYHNPADFMTDIACGEYGTDVINILVSGRMLEKEYVPKREPLSMMDQIHSDSNIPLPSMYLHFFLLLQRNLLIVRRKSLTYVARIIAHLLLGVSSALYYIDMGNDASRGVNNFAYLFATQLLIVFTGIMSVVVTFPMEIKMVRRETFNHWYKLLPHMLSVMIVETPAQILCAWAFVPFTYFLTGQPNDLFRFYYYTLFMTMCTVCAQSWGYFIGTFTTIKIALFVAPIAMCLLSIFGFYWYEHIPVHFQWLYHMSFFRAAFHNIVYVIYGMDRDVLYCPEERIYCYFAIPENMLYFAGIKSVNLVENSILIIVMTLFLFITTYFTLSYRINKR